MLFVMAIDKSGKKLPESFCENFSVLELWKLWYYYNTPTPNTNSPTPPPSASLSDGLSSI